MNLSVALATYNEEENIEKCLKSVFKWCDEIVVVDGKSMDKTVELAKKYKAKIILKENEKNFHKNKRIAIDNCKGDWILQLDADETVTDELKKEILNVISLYPKPYTLNLNNGYWIPRKNYFLGRFLKKGGQYPDYTLRLYRRGKGKLPAKNVHEQAEVSGETGYLKNPLLHYNYPDLKHYFAHFDRYTDIFAKEINLSFPRLPWKGRRESISFIPRHAELVSASLFASYLFIKPTLWFFSTYFRHKGFLDGYQGFLFSFFSSLRFPVSYVKAFKVKKTI